MAEVLRGRGDGDKGFRTANVNVPIGKGVYTCKTNYGYGLGICTRPNELEIHILGFNENIYGKDLTVSELKEIDKKLFLSIGIAINDIPPQFLAGIPGGTFGV